VIGRAYQPRGHSRAYVDETKQQARSFIVSCWRGFSGQSSIPGQYVTLCGPLADHGVLREDAELRQLEAEGLYKPSQFVGVNYDDDLQVANSRAVAAHYAPSDRPLLLTGDIIDVLHDLHSQRRLDASIIYLDTTSLLHAAAPLLWQTLNILNCFSGPRLVAWNMISGRHVPQNVVYPWDRQDGDTLSGRIAGYTGEHLRSLPGFNEAYRHGWELFRSCRYESPKTQMTTYVFARNRKACADACRCP